MMRGKTPCTALTYVRNGGAPFEQCLRSGQFCREHVVLDGRSTDGTRALAEQYGCRVVTQNQRFLDEKGCIVDFGGIANQALREAHEEWVVLLAADEECDEELIQSMIDTIRAGKKGAYRVPRYFLLNGRVIHYASMLPDYQLRLFHRGTVLEFRKPVHERAVFAPGVVPAILPHGYQYIPLTATPAELKEKYRRYLALEEKRFSFCGWWCWCNYATRRLLVMGGLTGRMLLLRIMYATSDCLPLRYDMLNIWYNWQLIKRSCPLLKTGTSRMSASAMPGNRVSS